MKPIIDLYDDRDLKILKPIEDSIPDFVKAAELPENIQAENKTNFALVMPDETGSKYIKKFPIFDQANTWLSALYFTKTASALFPEARAIAATFLKKACINFHLNVPPIIEKLASSSVKSNVIDFYAIKNEKPEKKDYLNLITNNFEKTSERYDPQTRCNLAKKIIEKYRQIGAPIKSFALKKYASANKSRRLKSNLLTRKAFIPMEELKEVMEKSAQLDPELLARLIMLLDKQYGVDQWWDHTIPDPYETVFEDDEVTLEDKFEEENGISPSALMRIAQNRDILSKILPDDILDNFSSSPVSAFKNMPKSFQVTIIKVGRTLL